MVCIGIQDMVGQTVIRFVRKQEWDQGEMKMTQIERIAHYESILDQVAEASAALEAMLQSFERTQSLVQELDAYYGSEAWRRDFADDEAGRLPEDLKRGVLSEDGAYDALCTYRQLMVQIAEEAAKAIR